jgi:outer membrane receptor protein involved in Fe transport
MLLIAEGSLVDISRIIFGTKIKIRCLRSGTFPIFNESKCSKARHRLYGRSEPGGIINILTKQPLPDRYASIDQIIGSYNYYRTMIDATGPLNESKTLLFRINGAYENTESFRDLVRGQRYFVAPVFTWKAGSNTTITIEGEYIRDRRTPDFGLPASATVRRLCPSAAFWVNHLTPSR